MKYSFVMLTWNRANYIKIGLPKLIQSIKDNNQSEIIIMDNNSSDDTVAVIRSMISQYKNIKLIQNKKNIGLNAYKKLFLKAKGTYIIEVDDDVLEMPERVDQIFEDYFNTFPDYGFLALNVVQNELTNGAKPGVENYKEDIRGGKTIEEGPVGGWFSGFRKKDFWRLPFLVRFLRYDLNFKFGEDTAIDYLVRNKLNKRCGIIKDYICFHASGPYYSQQFEAIDRDLEKYKKDGLDNFVDIYNQYKR